MARPQKEGLDYFPHDVYASSDEKIEPLILLYGAKGYAFYFLHLEYIYRNSALEFDISDAETREVIQQKLQISAEEYEQILQTALKKKCFDKEYFDQTNKLTSNGIKKRASSVLEKREKMRTAYDQTKKESTKERINKSKVKKKNCCISSPISDAEINTTFEALWLLYPSKKGKGKVSPTDKKNLYEIGEEQIKQCIERYKKTKPDWQGWQNGSTFFHSGYIDYLDENFTEEKKQDRPRIVRSAEDVSRLRE